jgi:predicted transport protein
MANPQNLDDSEKLNIIFKEILGFPSTSENINYYEELKTKYNTYTLGENVFLENIPQYPDFNINGIVRNAPDIGLKNADFYDYNNNPSNKSQCSIVDDSTHTVRRFRYLILEQTYGTKNSNYGASWFKLDNLNNNILEDSLQYNYKSYYDSQDGNSLKFPYLYEVFTQSSLAQSISSLRKLRFGTDGGNWIYNYKNGILFFSDFSTLAQQNIYNGIYNIVDNNKPVISVYKYIGRKNISTLGNSLFELTDTYNNNIIKIFNYTQNLTRKISELTHLFNSTLSISTNYSNKTIFSDTSFVTTTSDLIDLSNLFFNTITPLNINSNILININVTLLCSHNINERITIQLWRDMSMITINTNLGFNSATQGFTMPYSLTYVDDNIDYSLKKYYLKYQLESPSDISQGIVNVSTSNTPGASNFLLREIAKTPTIINFINSNNKLIFSDSSYTTFSRNIIDLSSTFYNILYPCNTTYLLVHIKVTLYCSKNYKNRINVELWRDNTLLIQDCSLGSVSAYDGIVMPYSITFLDENPNCNNSEKKYYLKYKIEEEEEELSYTNNQHLGIINVRTDNSYGSSNILLQEYPNISHNFINTYTNIDCTTTSNSLVDLSAIVFNTINPCNNSSIIVDIRTTLACSYDGNETITIELWRDSTLIFEDVDLGSSFGTDGLIIPYNITYLDENVTSGPKKYYLKYKLEQNISQQKQGILNIKTSQNGSPNILLREITNTSTIYNSIFYDITNFTTTTSNLIDLSDSFFNIINLSSKSNVLVTINVTLLCSNENDERITIQLWRNFTLISEDVGLGTYIASNLKIPYNLTYLDPDVNTGLSKYYLKYKLNNNSGTHMGLVNIKNSSTPTGSSSFFLRQI